MRLGCHLEGYGRSPLALPEAKPARDAIGAVPRIDDPERHVFALLVDNRSQAKAVAHGAPTRYLVALSGYAAGAH